MDWRPGVHILNGVKLPLDVEYTLSVNLKFLFPTPPSHKVALDWFEELSRKARLMTHFWDNSAREEPLDWHKSIPYLSTGWDKGIDDKWFADGIQVGRKALRRALHGQPIPRPDPRDDALFQIVIPPRTLRDWLSEAKLLALITDKNLGVSVVTREWYETQLESFLHIPQIQIEHRGKAAFDEFKQGAINYLEHHLLRTHRDGLFYPHLDTERVKRFWRTAYVNNDIPIFHGIPKIHKNPWKIRPIVPMHSYVLGPLGRILHAMLLPVQRSFSWICESSRNLCSEVADFNKSNTNPVRLHTGDVVSMYTNIKWRDFVHALRFILENGNWYDEQTRDWILIATDFIWHGALFQIGSKMVCQVDGVPMGLHCAPVFANLFMAHHEWLYFHQCTPRFYRRYIDDIFVIDPSDEAPSALSVPGLQIQWTHSAYEQPFLDVRFHTHPESAEVCFGPFNKALNHHQYLPWASSHPSSVKKGLIKGELSRVRAICYKEIYFLTWKATFLSRLRARGWPKRVLHSWGRQVQWRSYFPSSGLEARERRDAIIAVSKYNPVWEQVSSSAIWNDMRTEWIRGGPPDQPYPPHCIVAKKRTRSMWDLVRAVNRSILKKEIEETDIEELSVQVSSLNTDLHYSPP